MMEVRRRDPRENELHPAIDLCDRPMTAEEWKRYGPRNGKKVPVGLLKQSDIQRSLKHRGLA